MKSEEYDEKKESPTAHGFQAFLGLDLMSGFLMPSHL